MAIAPESYMLDRFADFIHEYQARVREAISLFQKYKGLENPMWWRQAGLKQVGFIDPENTVRYRFHGIGCRVKLPSGEVDWDFAYDERLVGLTDWFLYMFALEGTDRFPEFKDKEVLDAAFNEAIRQGIIERHPEEVLSQSMYFLRNEAVTK